MKAIVISNPNEIEIREVPMPEVKPGEALLKVKYDAFDELERAAKYIQKLCGNLKSEAQHVRKDNLEEMAVTYARTFMVAKCVTDIQKIVLKEINWFVTSGIKDIGSFDEERAPRSYEFGKFNNK